MNTKAVILICLVYTLLVCGCASSSHVSKENAVLSSPAVRQSSVLAIPSASNDEMARETGIPAVAKNGILTSRNMAILGKAPVEVPTTLRAERVLRDIQWISSGRPYDNMRYSVRIKSRFAP